MKNGRSIVISVIFSIFWGMVAGCGSAARGVTGDSSTEATATLTGTITEGSGSGLKAGLKTKSQVSGGTLYALDLTSNQILFTTIAPDGTFSVDLTEAQASHDFILIAADSDNVVTGILEYNFNGNETTSLPLEGASGNEDLGTFTLDSSAGTVSQDSGGDLATTVLQDQTIVPGQCTPVAMGYADADADNLPDFLESLVGQPFDTDAFSSPLSTFQAVVCFCAAAMGAYGTSCDPDDGIVCVLTQPLDTATVNTTNITAKLADGTDVSMILNTDSLFGAGNTLIATPASCPDGDVTLTLTTALHDQGGNALSAEFKNSFSFSGGDGSCNDTVQRPTAPPFFGGFSALDSDFDGIPDADDNYPNLPNMSQMPFRPSGISAAALAALGGNLGICCSSGIINSALTADQTTACSGICPGKIPGAIANAFGGNPLPPPNLIASGGSCPPDMKVAGNLCVLSTVSTPKIGFMPGSANDTSGGCSTDAECGPGLQCNAFSKKCNFNGAGSSGNQCGSNSDCGSGETCKAGLCVGGSCSSNSSCKNPTPICSSSVCSPCSTNSQCLTGEQCQGGACLSTTSVQAPTAGTCPSGTTLSGGSCITLTAITNLGGLGATCAQHSECQSSYCGGTTAARQCKTSGANGDVCTASTQCSSSNCSSGTCGVANGASCTTNAQCSSGSCNSGTCGAPLAVNGAICTADSGCSSGYCGGTSASRICKTANNGSFGDFCSGANQCGSALACFTNTCAFDMPASFTLTYSTATCAFGETPLNVTGLTGMTEMVNHETATSFSLASGLGGTGIKSSNTWNTTNPSFGTGTTPPSCAYLISQSFSGGSISPFSCTTNTVTWTRTSPAGTCDAKMPDGNSCTATSTATCTP